MMQKEEQEPTSRQSRNTQNGLTSKQTLEN